MTDLPEISVCICTYKRPEMLSKLLSILAEQETGDYFNYSAIIVDNDCAESARETVEACRRRTKIALSYYVEARQNIALARNKAIENARGIYIAFIDDDEFPEKNWLLNLYQSMQIYHADGVLGPVIPFYESIPPKWVVLGHFFDRPLHETGLILAWHQTRTGNILMSSKIFPHNSTWFDAAYGSGGEDRDFFRRKINEGYRFVWSGEARVFERISLRRWSRKVLIKRALLRGKMALISSKTKTRSVFYSFIAFLLYTPLLPLCLLLGHHYFMKYLIKDFDHIGKVLAFLGFDLIKEKYIMD